MTFELKITETCLQVCEDQRVVTIRRMASNSTLDARYSELEVALDALRDAAQVLVRAQNMAHTLAVTDGFHR